MCRVISAHYVLCRYVVCSALTMFVCNTRLLPLHSSCNLHSERACASRSPACGAARQAGSPSQQWTEVLN